MKKKRFAIEQITAILKQAELGMPVADLCRKFGISEQSFYRWKKIYGGMEPSETRELKQLREENAKLKRIVADLSLDKVMLQDVLQKKILKPVKTREMVRYLMGRYEVGITHACRELRISRSLYKYRSWRDPQATLRRRIVELAHSRVRYGYRRVFMLLKREGWPVGRKRVFAFVPRKAWLCGVSGPGAMYRRCID